MITGIDVSGNNGAISWPAVARAGHAFAYIKASEGMDFRDPDFAENWGRARVSGLLRGAYHFARPQPGRTGAQEAAWFCAVMEKLGAWHNGNLPPALDLEWGRGLAPGEVHAWASAFVAELRRRTGRTPIVYTGGFWKFDLGNPRDNLGCPLWLAQYASKPVLPAAWSDWTIWQYTDRGAVPALGEPVDLNRFDGTLDTLRALAHAHDTGPQHGERPAWPGHPLRTGATGESVMQWQLRMRARGFTGVAADGSYGPHSEQACRWLQMYKRLRADGVVGQATWSATWGPP